MCGLKPQDESVIFVGFAGDFECEPFKLRCLLLWQRLSVLFSWRKKKLKVDLGDLTDEKESLVGYLRTTLKAEATSDGNSVFVVSEELSPEELKKLVNKFVYHERLNNKYWVAVESGVVRIKGFKESKKPEKRKKEATQPATIKHGW